MLIISLAQDLLSWAKVVDPQDSFWGVSPSGIANMVMELRVAEEERMIVRVSYITCLEHGMLLTHFKLISFIIA